MLKQYCRCQAHTKEEGYTLRKEGTSDSDDKFLNKSQDLSQKNIFTKVSFQFPSSCQGKKEQCTSTSHRKAKPINVKRVLQHTKNLKM